MAKKTMATKKSTQPEQRKTYSLWFYIIPPVFLATLTAFFYKSSLHYAFQFDDVANITKHFSIRHQTLGRLFLKSTRWISYWLNSIHYSIGQFDPFSYRVGNVIIHTTNGLLIFFILFLALKNLKQKNFFSDNAFPVSFFTAILFLLHPVQTQTVSYVIQGQLEGLAALTMLSMVLCFFILTQAKHTATKYFFTLCLFAFGLLSCGTKEIAIISPALILLFDWFFVAQGEWSSLKKRMYLHAALFLFIFSMYLYFLKLDFFTSILGMKKVANNNIGNVITQNPKDVITPVMFLRSQFKVIVHYLWMFIWPFNISVEYDWVISKGIMHPDSFFPLLALVGIGGAIVKLLKKNSTHLVGFGALWFALCIAPRSSIIPSPELLVDYKTYLASLGWLFILASAGVWFIHYLLHAQTFLPAILSPKRHGMHVAGFMIAMTLGFMTINRNTVWRSGLDFWGNIIKNAPGKARAYNNYGVELAQRHKKYKEAISYYQKAISMDKNYADPLNNLSVSYSHLGRIDDAINALSRGLKIHPYYPEGYNNLASFYIQKGLFDKAEKSLNLALRLRPYYGKALFNKGRIFLKRGKKEEAWKCFKKSCTEADLDVKFGFSIYGQVSMELGKYDDAIIAYEKIMKIDPNDRAIEFTLANAYFRANKKQKAQRAYERIVARNPQAYRSWYNLAETYFEFKEYAKALEGYRKSYHLKAQLPYIQARMAHCLERTGKPYEAKKMIENFLQEKHNGNPQKLANLKVAARKILNEMNTKYPGKHATIL